MLVFLHRIVDSIPTIIPLFQLEAGVGVMRAGIPTSFDYQTVRLSIMFFALRKNIGRQGPLSLQKSLKALLGTPLISPTCPALYRP